MTEERGEGHSRDTRSRRRHRRNLPHVEDCGKACFVSFHAWPGRDLPEQARDLVLEHCLHDHGTKCHVHGVVVMPDHVHLVLTPMADSEGKPYRLKEIVGAIEGASAHSVNRLLGVRGHMWQEESFDRVLRSDETVQERVAYLCQNPVRNRLVRVGDEYPWLWCERLDEDSQHDV